jgi:hypothetical protein
MFRTQQPQQERPFSMEQLEDDIRDEAARRPTHPVLVRQVRAEDYAPPSVRAQAEPPIDVGKLTAAAIQQGYLAAAQEFEAMGAELTANLDRIDATKADTNAAIDELRALAEHYREAGRRVALQIENHAALTTEARMTAKVFKEKIASPAA